MTMTNKIAPVAVGLASVATGITIMTIEADAGFRMGGGFRASHFSAGPHFAPRLFAPRFSAARFAPRMGHLGKIGGGYAKRFTKLGKSGFSKNTSQWRRQANSVTGHHAGKVSKGAAGYRQNGNGYQHENMSGNGHGHQHVGQQHKAKCKSPEGIKKMHKVRKIEHKVKHKVEDFKHRYKKCDTKLMHGLHEHGYGHGANAYASAQASASVAVYVNSDSSANIYSLIGLGLAVVMQNNQQVVVDNNSGNTWASEKRSCVVGEKHRHVKQSVAEITGGYQSGKHTFQCSPERNDRLFSDALACGYTLTLKNQ